MSQSNFLVIMSDEHQGRAMGCAGHDFVKTPNLDRLAARGTRFSEAYTPCPICVPARASFATGKHVHETRLWDNAMPYTGQLPGWGHALQGNNIPVESIGKLHYRSEEDPAGFDVEHIPMMVVGGVGMVWASIRKEDERITPNARMLGGYIGPGESKYTEYDAAVTERTIEWIKQAANRDTPWCLYVGLVAPHFPLVVPEEYYEMYPEGSVPEPELHPKTGYKRHPWVEKQNGNFNSEDQFVDAAERRRAFSAYYGLVTWLDHNIGLIMDALDASGQRENTTVVYTSDHGDNVGERGLWGKSNLYQESVHIPMIMAGPDVPVGECKTPVSLLDLAHTIPDHFGVAFDGRAAHQPLHDVIAAEEQPDRPILSQYHAAGAVSGAYMYKKGRWKLNYYVDFPPELFDLQNDPKEHFDLANDPEHADTLANLEVELRAILDPEAVDKIAFADQADLIEFHGGRDAALALGAPGATPPPKV